MKPKDCLKLNTCPKIDMVYDKDLLEWQYTEAIIEVCSKCEDAKQEITGTMEVYEGESCDCWDRGGECLEPHFSISVTTDDGKVIECEDLPKKARIIIQEP